ncbi:hypothetical protein B446_35463 (plasmid) [Streptomyces collinus Tu 365]|uniref:Uncharacterized protein n=2 Tax=Streptomyces collinus TaxID=42684 RepID=S5V8H0_STRC3|nr:hypothetical protein B446_35463 [Streptomyces collinus Tu 365]
MPGACEACDRRKETLERVKNRLITASQSVLGVGSTALGGSGVWLFAHDQPMSASAAAVLGGLGFTAIKMLAKLRPRS